MFILSSAKIRWSIQDQMKSKYPRLQFQFCSGMEEAKDYIKKADILITYGEDITPELIKQAHCLKWIHVLSSGLDQMPFTAIKEREIQVTNARGIHQVPMAEYTIAMMLQVARNLPTIHQNQSNKVWDRKIKTDELHGKTIGILGAGAIGSKIAQLAKAFQMETIGLNRSGKHVVHFDEILTINRLESMLPDIDYLVSVLPKTPETDSLIKKKHFEKMKEDAVFINIGRGTTVDEAGLVEALKEHQIAHAVLDVMEAEPLPEDSPLWEMKNVTLTPHLSAITPKYQERAFEQFEENLSVFQTGSGHYVNKINLERGY